MHYTGPHARAAVGELLKMISECVRERAGVNSSSRMDDHACRLVNDDEGFVFVDDFNGNSLGSKTGRSRGNQFDFQLVVFA